MKTIKYLFGAFMAVAISSCTKLEEYNPGGATAEATWTTPDGFLTLVNAAYSEQRYYYGKEDGLMNAEAGTDLWFNANKSSYANQFTRYEGLSGGSASYATALWKSFYKAINLCDAGINHINEANFPTIEEKNKREAELRFLRAFYLWHVVETWGGVNLKLTETQGVELTAKRSSVEEFYNVILSDLEFAYANLPVNWGPTLATSEYGRATKKAALGFLARASLSRAYYATGAERTQYFTKARDYAVQLINDRRTLGVDLYSNIADVWKPANNKANTEAIYVVTNSATNTALNYDGNANRLHAWFLTTYGTKPGLQRSLEYGYDNQKRLQPTLALLDFYDESKDGRYSAFFQEAWIANKAYTWTSADVSTQKKASTIVGKVMKVGTDTALYITKKSITDEATRPYIVVDRDSMYNTATDKKIKGTGDFVALKKFLDYTRTAVDAQPGYNDLIVMRLAEIYLIAAEAEFQLGHPSPAADYLNVIRTRAALPGKVSQMTITAADVTLDFILDERARELCGEYQRWFDLKRTGKLVERVKKYNPDITAIQDYHVLRPIPQAELDALTNGAEFGQNPGY